MVRTLRNAVRRGRIAHAYLFTGPRGTGKTSMARILAKAVNCVDPRDGNPCNICEMCRAADEGRAMDVLEIDAASNTSVDHVRELRERIAYAAGEGKFKVYIVDEVHRLSAAAFDAFLKTLEEPPSHVIFVFASTEPHKVPETITSRCQRFDFHRIGIPDVVTRLRFVAGQEGIAVTDDAIRLLALHASGSLRDALGLLDQARAYTDGEIGDGDVRMALGLADASLVSALTDSLVSGQPGEGLSRFHVFLEEGGDPRQLTRQIVEYWRALLLVASQASTEVAVDPSLTDSLQRHATQLSSSKILAMIRALVDQEFAPKFNVPLPLPFELAYMQVALGLQATKMGSDPGVHVDPVPPPAVERQVPSRPPNSHASESHAKSVDVASTVAKVSLPSQAPPTSRASGEGSDVQSLWPMVIANMRVKSPSLQAVLRSGHLLRSENGEVTIGFLFDFHRSQFADPKKRKLVEEVIHEVMGTPYRVNCIRTTKEDVDATGASVDDDGFIDEVAERLREFHTELGNAS